MIAEAEIRRYAARWSVDLTLDADAATFASAWRVAIEAVRQAQTYLEEHTRD